MSDHKGEFKPEEMEGVEIPESQIPESQSSCETLMTQQSENEFWEIPTEKAVEVSDVKPADKTVNSSLEANTSGENNGNSHSRIILPRQSLESSVQEQDPSITDEGLGGKSQNDMFEDDKDEDDRLTKQETRKRKSRSDDSTPSPKRPRRSIPIEISSDDNHSVENQDLSVLEISTTPEKTIVIDDSQEFSLRIEEGSPSATQVKAEVPQKEVTGVKAPTTVSPTISTQSQKNVLSWSSQTQQLTWDSHKYTQDVKTFMAGDSCSQPSEYEKNSPSESCVGKPVDSGTDMETEILPVMPYGSWFIDSKTKMPSFKIKGFVFQEERPVEKPGRTSMVSTTSAKSSSSAGYVGLPGPFSLPGKTFRSRLSTVSSASSASSNPAWDGPFVKPFPLPESKQHQNVVLLCGKCDHNFPVDRHAHSSPVVNGSSPVIEEEISDAKTLTPRRGRKTSSAAGSTVSSGQLEEETSSSGAQAAPQASSTPTMPSRGRVKSRRKQDTTPLKSKKEAQPSKTPKAVGRRNRSSNTAQTVGKGEGEPVMARWGADGIYYPGWVSEPLTVAQVKVQFCDGQVKSTPVSKLVKADIITPGTLVLAATQSGEYEEALVVKVDMSGPEPVYMVERDKSERELQFDSIALNQSVVTELTVPEAQKAAAAVNFNDLSLENIIVHPRKRSARTPVNGGSGRKKKRQTTPQPCTSHGQTYSGPEETYGDTDSSTHSTCSLDLRGKEIKPLDIECFPAETTRTKLAYSRGNMAFKKKGKAEATVVSDLGPIPEPGSNLFTGCAFLITYTDNVRIRELNESPRTSSADDVIGTKQQLWRNRLQLQIRNGGGKVYNSFSEVTKEDLPNTYLITDKQCNTPLYLQCLVNNVPIYSHQIVIMCCAKNRQWKEVIAGRGVKRISGGYSLSSRCIVNPRSLTPLHKRNLLLALSGDPALSAFWQSLISKAGGSVDLHPHGPLKDNNYDVVVADTDCDRELVAEACSVHVPLVSMTWLHQVIITGEWRSPTEHPLYNYNSCGDGDGSPEY